jgi:enterochelin esterase family protein
MSSSFIEQLFVPAVGAFLVLMASAGLCAAGTIQAFRYDSAALGRAETAQVYLPSGEQPEEGWPILYLLHGLHGAGADWERLGGITKTLDTMIADRRIKPLIVVMPDGNDSWYVDSAAVGGPGDYATVIGQELPKAVEAAFPTNHHRAIAGISMGGYGALRFALLNTDRYAAVAALSPAIWQNFQVPADPVSGQHDHSTSPPYFQKVDPATITIGVDLPPNGDHFGTAFGSPFDPKRFNAANVFTLLERAIEAHKRLPPIYLSVGDDDSHRLWRGSIAFFETMQMNNLDVEFRVTDGDHNWTLWRKSVVDALVFVDAKLERPAVR